MCQRTINLNVLLCRIFTFSLLLSIFGLFIVLCSYPMQVCTAVVWHWFEIAFFQLFECVRKECLITSACQSVLSTLRVLLCWNQLACRYPHRRAGTVQSNADVRCCRCHQIQSLPVTVSPYTVVLGTTGHVDLYNILVDSTAIIWHSSIFTDQSLITSSTLPLW